MMPLDSDRYIVGVDEAGRGPLAGPVSVGIICVRKDFDLLAAFAGLNDSKKLSEKKREVLFSLLEEQVSLGTVRYTVEMADAAEIDKKGIAVCIRALVAQGLEKLLPEPMAAKVFLDGSLQAPTHFEQETIVGGDALVPAIMLASIAAKVTRDRLVVELAHTYPQYGFEKHKGYGTKAHMQAIRDFGQCKIHRTTFIHLD